MNNFGRSDDPRTAAQQAEAEPFTLPDYDAEQGRAKIQPLAAFRFEGWCDDYPEQYLDMCELLAERMPTRAFKKGIFEGRPAIFSTDGRRF